MAREKKIQIDNTMKNYCQSSGTYNHEGHGFADIKEMYYVNKKTFPLDFYKVLAVEGSMITIFGNLTMDASTGQIELEPLAFVGGGLHQVKEFLTEHANLNYWPAALCFTGAVLSLGLFCKLGMVRVKKHMEEVAREEANAGV